MGNRHHRAARQHGISSDEFPESPSAGSGHDPPALNSSDSSTSSSSHHRRSSKKQPTPMTLSDLPTVSDLLDFPRQERFLPRILPGVSPTYLVLGSVRCNYSRLDSPQKYSPFPDPGDLSPFPAVFLDPKTLEIVHVFRQRQVMARRVPFHTIQQVRDRVLFLNPAGSLGPVSKQGVLYFEDEKQQEVEREQDDPSSCCRLDFDKVQQLWGLWEGQCSSSNRGRVCPLLCESIAEKWNRGIPGCENDSVYFRPRNVFGGVDASFVSVVGDVYCSLQFFDVVLIEEDGCTKAKVKLVASLGRKGILPIAVAEIPWRKRVVSGGHSMALIFDDLVTLAELDRVSGHSGVISCIARTTNCDFDVVVSGSDDETARIWDCRNNEMVQVLNHSGRVMSLCSALDCWTICSVTDSATISCWDPRKPEEALQTLQPHATRTYPDCIAQNGFSLTRITSDSVVSTTSDFEIGTVRFRMSDGKVCAKLPSLNAHGIGVVFDADWKSRIQPELTAIAEEFDRALFAVTEQTRCCLRIVCGGKLTLTAMFAFIVCQ